MINFKQHIRRKISQGPGTLVHIGEQKAEQVTVNLIRCHGEKYHEEPVLAPFDIEPPKDRKEIFWLNICGLHDVTAIRTVGNHFQIHPLVQEDILNTLHRPKFENYDDYHFMVLKMIRYDPLAKEIISEQVSLILGQGYVVTFQELEGDVFEAVRERMRKPGSRFRSMAADYLFYALIDAVVDNYFLVLEGIGEEIEELEEELVRDPDQDLMRSIHKLKQEMIALKRATWPLREVINGLLKAESKLITKTTNLFFRDIYDHTIHVIETTESYRDMITGIQDLYFSHISNKMNEVMKMLTIIATIFIPLTFLAGVYGMNFDVMPELRWRFGYFMTWGVMLLTAAVMIIYFKRKQWL